VNSNTNPNPTLTLIINQLLTLVNVSNISGGLFRGTAEEAEWQSSSPHYTAVQPCKCGHLSCKIHIQA